MTGTKDAFEKTYLTWVRLLEELLRVEASRSINPMLAHGVADGKPLAWIEHGPFTAVLDEEDKLEFAPKELFYLARKIDAGKLFIYTPDEARKMLENYGHYGPWEGEHGIAPKD